jgi:hypothetical protein
VEHVGPHGVDRDHVVTPFTSHDQRVAWPGKESKVPFAAGAWHGDRHTLGADDQAATVRAERLPGIEAFGTGWAGAARGTLCRQ